MLYDRAEKLRRGYKESGSIVRQDGSEKLVGKDWKNRVIELWMRCEGQCEQFIPKTSEGMHILELSKNAPYFAHPDYFERCPKMADDPHHIKPRSKRRDDRLTNLQALCRHHHILLDGRKIGGRK